MLPRPAIERAVYPFLGPDRTIDTVKQAADALEKAYKDAGYGAVFVDIPEQEVADGLVRLKVTEGKLESRACARRALLFAPADSRGAAGAGDRAPHRRCRRCSGTARS